MNLEQKVTTVKGDAITVSDVIVHLKLKGLFRSAIYELIERKVIEQALGENNLTVDPADVTRRVQASRAALGITQDQQFDRYLRFYGVTADQWHGFIRHQAACEVLKHHLVTERQVAEAYRREPLHFGSVSIARIPCRGRAEAEAVIAAAADQDQDFVDLARRFSADDSTRLSGGFIGNVKRGMLPAEVEQQAFQCRDNQVIGPFREASLWTVYKVYTVNVPKLTDALRNVIRDQIFAEWLRHQVLTVPA